MATVADALYRHEVRLPKAVNNKEMQELILGFFAVNDTLHRIDIIRPRSNWIEERGNRLVDYETISLQDMRLYAMGDPTSMWATEVVPDWAAAGMRAGIEPDARVLSPSTLWMFCGMEHRRYFHIDHITNVVEEVLGNTKDSDIKENDLAVLAKRLDRPPFPEDQEVNRNNIYRWVTKRRHSEFLRTMAVHLGLWIERNRSSQYYSAYQQSLESLGQQAIDFDKSAPMGEIRAHARSSAVRNFLNDYFDHMPPGEAPRVLQR